MFASIYNSDRRRAFGLGLVLVFTGAESDATDRDTVRGSRIWSGPLALEPASLWSDA